MHKDFFKYQIIKYLDFYHQSHTVNDFSRNDKNLQKLLPYHKQNVALYDMEIKSVLVI